MINFLSFPPPEARWEPDGETVTHKTALVCPTKVWTNSREGLNEYLQAATLITIATSHK